MTIGSIVAGVIIIRAGRMPLAILSLAAAIFFGYKLLVAYTIWRFSYIKVNDEDIEHFASEGIFKEQVTVISFSEINNIAFEKAGPLSSVTGSGIIVLQTSSGEFRFYNARDVESAYVKLKSVKAGNNKLEQDQAKHIDLTSEEYSEVDGAEDGQDSD